MSRRALICSLLIACIVSLIYVHSERNRRLLPAARKLTSGCYTMQQALDRSYPIFSALFRDQASLSLSADEEQSVPGKVPSLWSIDCEDTQGRFLGHLKFYGNTGQIQQVSCDCRSKRRGQAMRAATQQELIAAALCWLRLLWPERNWRVTETVSGSALITRVECAASGCRATVLIERLTGALIHAVILPGRRP